MKLTKHQECIVDKIIDGKGYGCKIITISSESNCKKVR